MPALVVVDAGEQQGGNNVVATLCGRSGVPVAGWRFSWPYEEFNLPIGAWDTSRVTDLSEIFRSARAFNQPIGAWDVARQHRRRPQPGKPPGSVRCTSLGTQRQTLSRR